MKQKFVEALSREKPLRIVGVLNAMVAVMAQEVGFEAIYLSGAALSSGAYALPDLGMLSLEMVIEESWRITNAADVPLLVDIDTGWDNLLVIERAAMRLSQVGVSAVQIEDQVLAKRCGHREGKQLIDTASMCSKIRVLKAADSLFIIARTDALAVEGFEHTMQRAHEYMNAGADMIFVEAVTSANELAKIRSAINAPLLINLTEFGKTPLLSEEATKSVDALLYPMSVTRTMYKSAKEALIAVHEGKQSEIIDKMLTRDELYQLIKYEEKENKI
jgi:methylisocitrate lyase